MNNISLDPVHQRRLMVQSVLDRIMEFGPDYIEKLTKLNGEFKPVKHRIGISNPHFNNV